MKDSRTIATKLEEYLEADYFAEAIKNVYTLINHIVFLNRQVVDLKDTIARMQGKDR